MTENDDDEVSDDTNVDGDDEKMRKNGAIIRRISTVQNPVQLHSPRINQINDGY